jgi:acyl-CoA reductase-like NAD-dependent aldehyde dehydrogenase
MSVGKSLLIKEPKGVVFVIGPWNYPFNLVLLPLVGAIAAGNCCVIKPSEVSPASAALTKELVERYLDSGVCFCFKCVIFAL